MISKNRGETSSRYTGRAEHFSNGVNKFLYLVIVFFFVLFPLDKALCEPDEAPVNWQLNVKWEDVPLSEISLPDTRFRILDGYADVFLTIDNPQSSGQPSLKAEGRIEQCKIYLSGQDEELDQINGDFVIEDKQLNVNSLEGKFKDIAFNAEFNVNLISPYPFDVKIKAEDAAMNEIARLFPVLMPFCSKIKTPAEAEFNAQGVFPGGPVEMGVTFQEALICSVLMSNVEISFLWEGSKVLVRNFSANLDEGRISGEGEIILNTK